MKAAAIISCNDNYDYETRTKFVKEYFEDKGLKVFFIIADFDHRNKKEYVVNRNDNIQYIHVKKYSKNISVNRIISHVQFAKRTKKFLTRNRFDIVYHCAPPNSTIKELSKLKEQNKFYLITEIGDMWPETMPLSGKSKKLLRFPFFMWRNLRDKWLYNSDIVIAECNLFNHQLKHNTGLSNIVTMYFCKNQNYINDYNFTIEQNKISLVYLGSINNIIDFNIMEKLVNKISKRKIVEIHIIGDGEKKAEMISSLSHAGGKVVFHGQIYDDELKKKIFSKCQYALNIMREDVYVGMTMKSLDYFSFGIPIINNIGADMSNIVKYEKIGMNITYDNCEAVAEAIIKMSEEEYALMRKRVQSIHSKYFSISSFYRKMDKLFASLGI